MTTKICGWIFVLCLASLATSLTANAQTGIANGRYKFIMEDEFLKFFEFDARTDERGGTTGFLQFADEAKIVFQDVDGTGEPPPDEPVEFHMTVDLDAMTIEKNRAVISGTIRDSSYRSYIGQWVQLAIEDNDGIEIQDRFVLRVCQPELGGWIPEDSEVPGDRGAHMSWWATDAERKDDVGIPSPNIIPGNLKGCRTYPLRAYDYTTFVKGDGIIQVLQ